MSKPAVKILRPWEWAFPVMPVDREVVKATPPERDETRPPLLFVPGLGHGAWIFTERWLEHATSRGFSAFAMRSS